MSLGEYIRAIRLQRNLSQWELSRLSGLSRSHLSRLELDAYERPSAQTFLALSRGLKVQPNDLYQAAGYTINARSRRSPPSAATRIAGTKVRRPAVIPVIVEIQSEEAPAMGYVYFGLTKKVNKNIIGVLVTGFCLKPHIQEGDVVIVDRAMKPSPGNIVLCQRNEKTDLAYYDEAVASSGNGSGNYHIYGVVIGVSRNLV